MSQTKSRIENLLPIDQCLIDILIGRRHVISLAGFIAILNKFLII